MIHGCFTYKSFRWCPSLRTWQDHHIGPCWGRGVVNLCREWGRDTLKEFPAHSVMTSWNNRFIAKISYFWGWTILPATQATSTLFPYVLNVIKMLGPSLTTTCIRLLFVMAEGTTYKHYFVALIHFLREITISKWGISTTTHRYNNQLP